MKTLIPILFVMMIVGRVAPYDWNAKIGTYTLDEAEIEFGPPHLTANLDDGGTVVSWIADIRNPQDRRVLRFEDGKLFRVSQDASV